MDIIMPITVTDAMMTDTDVPENDYAAYSTGTTYGDGDRVIDTSAHKIYESLQAANTGNALTDTDWWLAVGATNRWRVFDKKVGAQTSQADLITYEITPGANVDAIALLNLDAATVHINVTDPVAGEVYDNTFTLNMVSAFGMSLITDWYVYFFGQFPLIPDMVRLDLTPYLNAVITIEIANPGETVRVGEIVMGLKAHLGGTTYNPSIGITDYSTKEANAFGEYEIVERPYSKRLVCRVEVPNENHDQVTQVLSYYRAKPVVFMGSELFASMIIYGFLGDWEMVIPYPTYSELSMEIEGLA